MARKSFLLRISPELYADLEKWAADEMRSVNGQIEFLLRNAVQQRKQNMPSRDADAGTGSNAEDEH